MKYHQRMGKLPLKKRVNRDKCSFATKQRMVGVFAIDEILRYRGTRFPGSRTLCHPGVYRCQRTSYSFPFPLASPLITPITPSSPQTWLVLTRQVTKGLVISDFEQCGGPSVKYREVSTEEKLSRCIDPAMFPQWVVQIFSFV